LNEIGGPTLAGANDDAQIPIGESQPLPFPNGNWDPETGIV
jgi:hypothetical protein